MKKFLTVILILAITMSLCACAPKFLETPDGATVAAEPNAKIFTYESDRWVVDKIDRDVYYVKGYGTKTDYSMVIKTDEYACKVSINAEQYALMNIGDIITGNYSETYYIGETYASGSFEMNGEAFSATCYKR